MEFEGWIKLYRKIIENPVFQNEGLLQLYIYCLLRANYNDTEIIFNDEIVKLPKGSFITGRKVIAKDLRISENTIYSRLKRLEKLQYISINPNSKFSIISVSNYNLYQSEHLSSQQSDNIKSTTGEQCFNTDKNNKKVKKNNKEYSNNFELKRSKNYHGIVKPGQSNQEHKPANTL